MRRVLTTVLPVAVLAIAVAVGAALVLAGRDDDATAGDRGATGPGTARTTTPPPRLDATLRRGSVVLLTTTRQDVALLRTLATEVAGTADPTPALETAGQAVVVRQTTALLPARVVALSATRELRAASPTDPALRTFAEAHLGRPAR
ncbi:hypothetical protein [Conexibacter sp. SYSU D00693]|uniref:hypothetical protein n=1 Tax=Conexibacter sp. SYSU D00693 TaxID=2812560 RepID=UPI00196AEF9E|nr:hypothetical protein [Conexibacter sp. SYSU D00693]